MACRRFSTTIAAACRDSQPGITKLFIANYDDILTYTLDTAGTSLSGMTCTGVTTGQKCFYEVALNKQVGALVDTPTINLPNGVAISKPKVSGFVQGMTPEVVGMYKSLLQSDVVVVAKTIDAKLYIVGVVNGLSMSTGTYGTEAAVDGKKGFTFELDGIEPYPMLELLPTGIGLTFEATFVI
jgi:hypothetical protein